MRQAQTSDATPPRSKVTGRGLFWAFGVVLLSLNLIGSVLLVAIGPREQRGFGIVVGVLCALLLAGFAWTRPDREPAEPVDASSVKQPSPLQYALLEGFLVVGLIVQVVLFVVVRGPERARFAVVAAIAVFGLVQTERARRRNRDPGG